MFPVTMNILTMASLVGATSRLGLKLREYLLKQTLEDTYEQVQFFFLNVGRLLHTSIILEITIWHCFVQIMT